MEENYCNEPKTTKVAESKLMLNRRHFLGAIASAAATLGLSSIASSAEAATKKYKVCSTKDIKVGSATRFQVSTSQGPIFVLITQPKAKTYRAFNATCTHAGQLISSLSGTNLRCDAHGATFNMDSGRVTGGPAPRALTKYTLTVTGTTIYINA
ncbi:MAG: hypothetical protein RIQ88_992 [Actinomycetota bacterium]|jgi:nitrite reductase/ring-hydroxylating ferredoxin subunit